MTERSRIVVQVGFAQLLAWACSFYLPAIVAAPIAQELGLRTSTVFAAFSVGLLVAAFLGPMAGRWVDARGGRPVLMVSNIVFAAGLVMLSQANGVVLLFLAWGLMGVGMACGLYEAAFAAVVRWYGHGARNVIVGVTLLGGFASTLSWPLTTALETQWGWRATCLAWAMVQMGVAFPLHWLLPAAHSLKSMAIASALPSYAEPHKASTAEFNRGDPMDVDDEVPLRTTVLLSMVFAITLFISTAMAAHLPQLMAAGHVAQATAVLAAGLVGPAQVAGRLLELGPLGRMNPLHSARLASGLHPLGAIIFAVIGAPTAVVFAVVHGIGNGLMTIAKGTLPLVIFGARGYGERQGVLMIPARLAQSAAPWLFGLLVDDWGAQALWVSAALGVIGMVCLYLLQPRNGLHLENSDGLR